MKRNKNEYVAARDRINLTAGDVITMTCKERGINQTELAKRAGIQRSNLSLIIKGKRAIGKAVAEKIAKALEVTPSFILFAGERPRDGSDEYEAVRLQKLQETLCAVRRIVRTSLKRKNPLLNQTIEPIQVLIDKAITMVSPNMEKAPLHLVATAHKSKASHVTKKKH